MRGAAGSVRAQEEAKREQAGVAARTARRAVAREQATGPGAALLTLQRTAGNAAVASLVARARTPAPEIPVQRAEDDVKESLVFTESAGHGTFRQKGNKFDFEPMVGVPMTDLSGKDIKGRLGGRPRRADPLPGRPQAELTNTTGIPGMVMEFDGSPLSFAHRSYNGNAAAPNGHTQPNDHLTVENSLGTALVTAKQDPENMYSFLQGRMGRRKPDFNDEMGWHGYGEIDNLHFRPGATDQRRANGTAVEASDVDTDITLRQFLDFVDHIAARLDIAESLRTQLRASVEQVQGRMGIAVERMYFSTAGRRDFAKFVVLARQLTGQNVPGALEGLTKKKAELPYGGSTCVEGEADFNQAVNELIGGEKPGQYWPDIVRWATNLQPA